MAETVSLQGSLEVGAQVSGGCGPQDVHRHDLELLVDPAYYESIVNTPAALRIETAGAIGAAWEDLDVLDDLVAVELLYLRSSAPIRARIGAAAAAVEGVAGTFPTGFGGGETLLLTIDALPQFTTTFDVADQSAAQVAARINAAAALAGHPTPRASVLSTGQLRIEGVATGKEGSVAVGGGTGAATLGLTGLTAVGSGADVDIKGTFLCEFPRYQEGAPQRVQLSGVATVKVFAAGRTTA